MYVVQPCYRSIYYMQGQRIIVLAKTNLVQDCQLLLRAARLL